MINADYHIHTSYSADCECSPEIMIASAIERGLRTICITDHMDKDFSFQGKEFMFDLESYRNEISNLQSKYDGKIQVLLGVELGLQPHLASYLSEYVKKCPFDYVLGSVHLIHGKDPYFPDFFEGKTDQQAYEEMLDDTISNLQMNMDFDVLGHLDYTVRYGQYQEKYYSYELYQDKIDTILKLLIEQGKGLEVNTAGLKYGLSFAHPHPKILERYLEMGGEIVTIGSDAHKPEHVGYEFLKTREVLRELGLKYFTKFVSRKPIFEKI